MAKKSNPKKQAQLPSDRHYSTQYDFCCRSGNGTISGNLRYTEPVSDLIATCDAIRKTEFLFTLLSTPFDDRNCTITLYV
jgi:hypothetical protein